MTKTVKAIGTDLTDVARIRRALERYGERFTRRVFTENERRYCDGKANAAMHYAGRFAAKEAVLKVLDAGFVSGAGLETGGFAEIEILRAADGRPSVRLHAQLAELARGRGIDEILVSITHTETQAMAFALGQGAS